MTPTVNGAGTDVPVIRGKAARPSVLAQLARRPLLTAALLVVLVVTVAVYAAPLIAPAPPLQQDILHPFAGTSGAHPLGTDDLGRDILSRLLYGGRPSLTGVAVAVAVFAIVGMVLGILAGYLLGWADRIISPVLDIMLSVPGIIVILAVLAVFNQNIYVAMLVLGLFASANLARVIRSSCIAIREELFVDAARVSGLGPVRIMTRHVLPGLTGLLLVQMSLFAGIALGVQTGLGFLGLGTQPPQPSWGGMIADASQVIQQHPTFLLITGGVIGVMTIAFGLIGDGLRDLEADRRRLSGQARATVIAPLDEQVAAGFPDDPSALLTVRGYSVAFETSGGPRAVVDSISFTMVPGEVFGIVGESGSGKTVTALSLLGLLPENGAVTGGTAWLGSRRISQVAERELLKIRGHEIGLVSQEPMVALDPHYPWAPSCARWCGG